jgi:ribosomal protein S18 acetylase RimI-like enzyme
MRDWKITPTPPAFEEHATLWSFTDWPLITSADFDRILRGTDQFACTRQKTQLIGMARLVTDAALYGYIQDVIVHPSFRKQGIGRALVAKLLKRADYLNLRFVGLFSTLTAQAFYERQGFTQLTDVNIGLGRYLK